MILRKLLAGAIALGLSIAAAFGQTSQGTSPLTGAKGGTNNGFMQFAGPAGSMKTYMLANASGTIAMINQAQGWTGAQSFGDGTLILLGVTSGSSTLKAPATGGGTATLFSGTDTIVGAAATQTLTNKTMSGSSNTFSNIPLGSAVSGVLPPANGGTGLSSYAQHDIPIATGPSTLAPKSLPDCPDSAGQHLNYTRSTQSISCGNSGGGGGTTLEQMNPGGRLTLSNVAAWMTTDQAGATSVYYSPFSGKYVPIFNGSAMQLYAFTANDTDTVGPSITLGSNWAASTIFDVFVGLDSGAVRICSGPAWTTSTAGAGARSAGLAVFKGLLTNAASMTCRYNNTTTFTCAINQCTWLGAFITNGNAGQIDFKFGSAAVGGGAAIFGVCNAYNQVPAIARVVDTTTSWTSGNGNLNNAGTGAGANNRISVLSCNGATPLKTKLYGRIQLNANGAASWLTMGLNSTGLAQTANCSRGLGIQNGTQGLDFVSSAECDEVPPLGLNFIQAMQANTGAQTIVGGVLDQRLVGDWWW
ncbi:hypothetical protein [Bradyrhizobium sp. SZCCHNS3002]|uniref:hypothetical protein n=1 Tax=Bradyrhizobium sp. SZCCHNS3002 TaxID=3057310 RepID=UPI0028E77B4D|nr:hypothetical protein [Bradyrhizobium sp. SZCCHNS3002]